MLLRPRQETNYDSWSLLISNYIHISHNSKLNLLFVSRKLLKSVVPYNNMSDTWADDEVGLRNMAIALSIALPITSILLTTCGCCYFWRIRNANKRKRAQRSMEPRPPAYSRDPPISLPVYLPRKPEQVRNGDCA